MGSTTQQAVRHHAGSLSSARKSGAATAPCLSAASRPRSPNRTRRLRARMGTAPPAGRASAGGPFATLVGLAVCVAPPAHVREHSGKSRLAQHPTRRCAAVRRGTRPCSVRDATGVPWRANGRRGTPRVHGLGHCSNACDARRAGPAVCHAHCAGGGSRRCEPSAKRGLAGMPHLGRTPQHLMRSPVCPGGRAWRLASRLAVPRIAYTLTLLSRSRAAAHLGAGSPGTVAVPVGPTSRRVAHGFTHGQVHLAPPEVMQIALRRRLRLPLPLGPRICGQHGHGCRRRLDPWGDHALACTRSGLLARRASWSSKPGSQYAARRWERRDTLSPSSGCRTRRRQESRRQTADASTSWCTAPRPRASPFVAMPRWLAPSPERVPLTHERTILPASPGARVGAR